MRGLAVALLSLISLTVAAAPQTFTGTISDNMCEGSHASMRMGPTDAECTKACVEAHGASYVLFDGKRALALSDQTKPEAFAGRRVTVVGTLDSSGKTIRVESISARP